MVPVGDSFLIVGGCNDCSDSLFNIYRYERLSDTWALQEAKVPEDFYCFGRIAMMVDVDIFPSC